MSITFGKWERVRKDGSKEPLAVVQVTHKLTRDELAGLLAANVLPSYSQELCDLPKAEVEKKIREQLATNPNKGHYWGDEYRDEYEHEVTFEEVLAWARKQVARF